MAKPQPPKAAKTRPQPAKTAKTKPEASKTVGTQPQKPKTQKAKIPPKLTPKSVTKGVAVERPKSSVGSPPVREVHLSAASSEESSSVVADSTSEGVACGEDTISDQGQNDTASIPSEGVMCDTDTLSDTGQSGTASSGGALTRVVTPNTACTISTGSCVTLAWSGSYTSSSIHVSSKVFLLTVEFQLIFSLAVLPHSFYVISC